MYCEHARVHTRTHARTYARTQAHTHTHIGAKLSVASEYILHLLDPICIIWQNSVCRPRPIITVRLKASTPINTKGRHLHRCGLLIRKSGGGSY